MALEEPAVVATLDEGPDHRSGLLEGFEVVQIDALLLERADEALRDAVALRFAPVGGRGADAEPLDLSCGVGSVARRPSEPSQSGQIHPHLKRHGVFRHHVAAKCADVHVGVE